ncbi:sulfatase-like hydrolase/transferase [Puniceicoccaceae bacterium K14]|nr:sulfatase-like hydrolase/transferase [Puniceicoccaceae bacterium K14]
MRTVSVLIILFSFGAFSFGDSGKNAKSADKKPLNIVVITTDQQRADAVGALGNPHMITPNMDRLVNEGVSFTSAYVAGNTCISSRAAFYTGQFPHNTGCYGFQDWSHNRSWVEEIRDSGYYTAAMGKVHHYPATAMMGYDERLYTENFPDLKKSYDDYANYLKAEGQESPTKLLTQAGDWLDKHASNAFPLEEKYHVDQFVGRMATRWIQDYDYDKPFFLHIGFQGPHDPYDPPQRFIDMYEGRDVPLPHFDVGGLESRPPHYARFMEACRSTYRFNEGPDYGVWAVDLTDMDDEAFKRMRRHYYAKITGIDYQVGKILDMLEERGLMENTLIIFTSDHGDNLGDHELIYKWLMTEQSVTVPFVVRLPGGERAGERDDDLFTQIDVGPTILAALGLEVPQRLDGRSNWNRITKDDRSEVPEIVYCEDNYLVMARSKDRKLIYYAGQEHEEYFNMETDPWEEYNLVNDPAYKTEILELKAKMLEWFTVSRYLGSLSQVNKPNGKRGKWPANHPEDPYVLSTGPKTPEFRAESERAAAEAREK